MSKPRLVENYLPAYQEQIRAELAKVPHPRTIAIEPAPPLPVAPVRARTLRQQTGERRAHQYVFRAVAVAQQLELLTA